MSQSATTDHLTRGKRTCARFAAAARNKAFSLSSGDYIQWLDADDLLAPDKVAAQMQALEECPNGRTVLSASWGYFFHRPSRASFTPTGLWCDLSPLEWLLRKMEHNIYMQTATWLVPRAVAEAAGPWDTRLLGDDDGEYFTTCHSWHAVALETRQVYQQLMGR